MTRSPKEAALFTFLLTPAFVGASALIAVVTLVVLVALLLNEHNGDDKDVDMEDTWW
ncbi:hypothetical protein [Mycobacterium avium]|uniref:hypothetical protein n=1 Tax=Mycobacterium avium TaxID=1764 RepID=UPI000213AEC0|nr:hypothetical protein [Mycobacterium avium]ETB06295.1 hypothetical protein O979_01750 [Mycobacterium avium subsp. paratuberculosis 10-4404]ETB07929.1 hypothetical protein O978_01865 [Mycobacterium avium subsp. paratuberculosis 10-5864]ETB36145.1 hypothetical protein O977_01950 [Mycobacterium avium subsp. paratuberculosis 10-5975]ETB44392.1 hypothetical protein O975_02055 [Mycobacterium avium subsp. paratuberculosis 11-1786]ETB54685.1 hypothetical protein O976_02095 [Mycobacterium avium subsp